MILQVANLDVDYGKARAVSDVSLHVKPGEMLFLVGRNGAGKTTLLKTISGFIRPTAGTIDFDGADIAGLGAEQVALKGMRYVFQDKRVFSQLTVRENIELAAYPAGIRLADAIDTVVGIHPAIAKFLDSKAGGLSGGQRQLLLLGRALIGDPKLLLIDEPTEGLAQGTIREVFEVLDGMKGRLSMVIVEQNLSVVCRLADRVYAMREGRILAELTDPAAIADQAKLETYL
ncbi:MAG: ATP-binding cassette domain-containing protein [Magnetospirillum sp.]|nr:ATP-binding cassette domain-containing protein [Magnetospirillum sp.]